MSGEPTEVRANEQSKGGMKYELLLADPTTECPTQRPASPPKNNLSVEDIENKLKAAEERRLILENQKVSQLIEKRSRLNEVNQKKQEYNANFMQTAKVTLEQRTEAYKEKREAHLKSIQEKLKEHGLHVDEVRKLLESNNSSDEIMQAIQKKLDNAAEAREAQINALQERLKEHDKHVADVKKQFDEQVSGLRDRLNNKLKIAQEKRDSIMNEIQEKLQSHRKHVMEVRQLNEMNEKDAEDKLERISRKLDEAESKRLIQIQALQERLLQHERHIEEVRQQKAQYAIGVTNTSG